MKSMKCAMCGRKINHTYYLRGKWYGYNCYRQQIALLKIELEEKHNSEYEQRCYAAMEVFAAKSPGEFHDSICDQWSNCHKLTGRQFKVILDMFTASEMILYWTNLFYLTDSDDLKQSASKYMWNNLSGCRNQKLTKQFIDNEAIYPILLYCNEKRWHKNGFVIWAEDIDDSRTNFYRIEKCGKDDKNLKETQEQESRFEDVKILKVVRSKDFMEN